MIHKSSLAVITFVFNEFTQLPRWYNYYSKQVNSAEDLYVIDHGSTDGSVEKYKNLCNVIRLDREEGSDNYQQWRVFYISNLVKKLLLKYKYVMYVDCDEYVVVEPSLNLRLCDYAENFESPVSHAIGFDVLHNYSVEPDLQSHKVSLVRSLMQFVAAMCKPVFTNNINIIWEKGFHASNIPPRFGDLYLFHLRYADLKEGLERLKITRSINRPQYPKGFIDHQTISDQEYKNWISQWIKRNIENSDISINSNPIFDYIKSFNFNLDAGGIYKFDYSYRSGVLFKIPDRFKGVF